jgi:hypothetical protein
VAPKLFLLLRPAALLLALVPFAAKAGPLPLRETPRGRDAIHLSLPTTLAQARDLEGARLLGRAFEIDARRPARGLDLRTAIFSTRSRRGNAGVDRLPPFSRETGPAPRGAAPVPEPSAALLFAAALLLVRRGARIAPAPA